MESEGLRSKRSNVSERVRVDVPVDKISQLPDYVLSHILSLLPTMEEVVRTSILSKRWKNLWTYVHTLVFRRSKIVAPEKMQFSQFVNRVLQCHRGSIKKMELISIYVSGNDHDIRNWISYAVDHGVEILRVISIAAEMKFRWPFCLFHSQTLVDLSLDDVDITELDIPSAPFFPSLKKLKIFISTFDIEPVEKLQLLISGCSLLEDLSIKMNIFDEDFLPELSLNIFSSTLKRLVMNYFFDIGEFDPNFCPKIGLDVPALEFLSVNGYPTEFFVKDQLSSLTEVEFVISSTGKGCCRSLVSMMKHITNVKVLRLELSSSKALTFAMNAKFPNLTKLEIMSSFFEWRLLGSFMESSINLECITLQGCHSDTKNRVYWIDPQNVPYCLLSSLKKISIRGDRIENALDMTDYVLRNAEYLERMDIKRLNFGGNYEAQCKILRKLVMMKRASRECEILFV